MVLASLVAYAISQTLDVRIFLFWKRLTGGKHLWFRNNASTIVSQLVDTFIFLSLAHATVESSLSIPTEAIIAHWLFKLVFSLLDTPAVYLLVRFIKRGTSSYTTERVVKHY